MAQTRKQTAKKTTAASGKKKTAAAKRYPQRGIGAAVCFVLGFFSILCFFKTDAVFISFLRNTLTGLFGWGMYVWPLALLYAAYILAFHKGKPVKLRVTCTLIAAFAISCNLHLFFAGDGFVIGSGTIKTFWNGGKFLECGGLFGGIVAEVCERLFSKIGAGAILFVLLILSLIFALNKTFSEIIENAKNRRKERIFAAPQPEPQPEQTEIPEVQETVKPVRTAESVKTERRRKRIIDIPIDGEVRRTIPEKGDEPELPLFVSTPGVKTPAEQMAEYKAQQRALEEEQRVSLGRKKKEATEIIPEEPVPDEKLPDEPSDEDVEIIPFMDKPIRRFVKETAPVESVPEPDPVEEFEDEIESYAMDSEEETPAQNTARVNTDAFFGSGEIEVTGPEYSFPPVSLLAAGSGAMGDSSTEVNLNAERLETAFKSFGVNVAISSYTRGPTVTRYEVELEAGIKLSRLTNLSDDIALALGVNGVRIAAMPNKIATVGIEVPNKLISTVYLRDIIESPQFKDAKSSLTFAVGKNIGGDAICGNIAKMPHLLVAGTTGSGKSVCLNSLILSILYKATPDEVKFIMIDPKMVEFGVYNGIPHLLVPVVTDVKKAAGALQWAVVEMMKRYRLFLDANVREIDQYNEVMRREEGETIPKLVVVIDELADLMLTVAKEVEDSVCRIAQMGRAAGVHLVIATQSPRSDVITGLMKANIPSRIALKVSSALESRIILDSGGNAEKLVGNGDMLFAPIGADKPVRVQGTWVSDEEREEVVEYIKKRGESQYAEDVISQINKAVEEKSNEKDAPKPQEPEPENDRDELLPQAVDVIFESGQASVSMLQRRLKLGYSRAARIVDQLEDMGIVGPFEGSKPRQLLITKEQWHEMQYINGTAPSEVIPVVKDDYESMKGNGEDVPF